ncbi:hypothetical protein ACWGDX_01125 [Streptomyces sp. NPDC055025]
MVLTGTTVDLQVIFKVKSLLLSLAAAALFPGRSCHRSTLWRSVVVRGFAAGRAVQGVALALVTAADDHEGGGEEGQREGEGEAGSAFVGRPGECSEAGTGCRGQLEEDDETE